MKNNLNILFACFYLLANVLSAGQVICNGADGHSSVKRHIENHCASSDEGQHTAHGRESHDSSDYDPSVVTADQCEPCVDIPLQHDVRAANPSQPILFYGVIKPYVFKPRVILERSANELSFPIQLPRPSQLLESLRTVIILI